MITKVEEFRDKHTVSGNNKGDILITGFANVENKNPSFGSRSIQGRIHIPLAIISVTLSIGLLMRLPEVKIASCW